MKRAVRAPAVVRAASVRAVAVCGALSAALVLSLAGCSGSGDPAAGSPYAVCRPLRPSARPHPDAVTSERITAVVAALAGHAWNPAATSREAGASGGLYVNWRSAWDGRTDPASNTNIATSRQSDADAGAADRHDPLNDLLILRDLDAYLATGSPGQPAGDDADRLRCRLQPVVAAEFAHYGVYRGWVYFQLIDLSRLDPDGPWSAAAQTMAGTLSTRFVDPVSHAVVDPKHTSYASSQSAQSAAALLDAGARFGRPDWTTQGRLAAARLVSAAADARTGLFPDSLTSRPTDPRDRPVTGQVRVGAQAQLLDALLTCYDLDHDATLLAAVHRAVASLLDPAVGVIDTTRGGFYFAVDLTSMRVRRDYKETRQAWMLPLLEHLSGEGGSSDPGSVTSATASMAQVVRDRFYRPDDRAFVYRVSPDWHPFVNPSVQPSRAEDWISTEASGIALLAMLGPLS